MDGTQNKKLWNVLAFICPGVVSVSMTAIDCVEHGKTGLAIIGLPVALLLCIAAAIFLVRGKQGAGRKVGFAFLYFALLVVVNFSIAFGGCALMPVPFDVK
jgi:hypothetical protein